MLTLCACVMLCDPTDLGTNARIKHIHEQPFHELACINFGGAQNVQEAII